MTKRVIAGIAVAVLTPWHLHAQVPGRGRALEPRDSLADDTLQARVRHAALADAHRIRWYEVAAVAGGVAALTLVDQPVQRFAQRHRSNSTDDIASVFRQEGEPIYYAGVSLGVLAVGVVAHDADITRAGGRLVTSVALSGVAGEGMKLLLGRSRPNEEVGAFAFHPFTRRKDAAGVEARGAMPSGHTTAAFAVATSLADDIDSPVADILLYVFAAGTAFSRVNDNRHWLSDTGMGAALGVTTAKLVSGKWRVFNLRPPSILVLRTGAPALKWSVPF